MSKHSAADTDSAREEAATILCRQRLMSVPGGVEWLLHVCRLYGHNYRFIRPSNIGVPYAVAVAMEKA